MINCRDRYRNFFAIFPNLLLLHLHLLILTCACAGILGSYLQVSGVTNVEVALQSFPSQEVSANSNEECAAACQAFVYQEERMRCNTFALIGGLCFRGNLVRPC